MIVTVLAVGIVASGTFLLLWRLLGPNPGTRASDGLASASPAASQDFYGSMSRDDELGWFHTLAEPDWIEQDRAWRRRFAATHPAQVVEAAFNQRGGWTSGECWPSYGSGDGGMVAASPPLEIPPRPVESAWAGSGPGWADMTGPGHGATGEPWTAACIPAHETPRPGQLTVVPEIAHDEYAGPAANSPVESPAAGPVPHTPDDIALAAQVQAWVSQMDADTLSYLHDYKERLHETSRR